MREEPEQASGGFPVGLRRGWRADDESLSFGFYAENRYWQALRIWSRLWLTTR